MYEEMIKLILITVIIAGAVTSFLLTVAMVTKIRDIIRHALTSNVEESRRPTRALMHLFQHAVSAVTSRYLYIMYALMAVILLCSAALLLIEFFFSAPYATWTALIAAIGLALGTPLSLAAISFFHLNSRIDQLNQRIDTAINTFTRNQRGS